MSVNMWIVHRYDCPIKRFKQLINFFFIFFIRFGNTVAKTLIQYCNRILNFFFLIGFIQDLISYIFAAQLESNYYYKKWCINNRTNERAAMVYYCLPKVVDIMKHSKAPLKKWKKWNKIVSQKKGESKKEKRNIKEENNISKEK